MSENKESESENDNRTNQDNQKKDTKKESNSKSENDTSMETFKKEKDDEIVEIINNDNKVQKEKIGDNDEKERGENAYLNVEMDVEGNDGAKGGTDKEKHVETAKKGILMVMCALMDTFSRSYSCRKK